MPVGEVILFSLGEVPAAPEQGVRGRETEEHKGHLPNCAQELKQDDEADAACSSLSYLSLSRYVKRKEKRLCNFWE